MKFILLFFLFVTPLFAQPKVPELTKWATDLTGTLSSQELNNLNARLKTFEDSTSNQLTVLVISKLGQYPIEYYTMDVVKKNQIGTKKFDNGILILVVKDDHKARIEVGYGLEGALPDALASSIIRNEMIPYFKKDQYFAGIDAGVNAVISATKGEYTAQREKKHNGKETGGIFKIILMLIFIVFFFLRGGRRRRGGFIYWGGGFGGSSGGFGGSSGGSFGGFSGGGGSFGGGGASGSW